MHIKEMNSFTLKNIPYLDTCVLASLELFGATTIPKIKIPYKRPLVVGSGNAAATGRIIFANRDAIFADESTVDEKLKIKSIDGVVLLSASGVNMPQLLLKKQERKNLKLPSLRQISMPKLSLLRTKPLSPQKIENPIPTIHQPIWV